MALNFPNSPTVGQVYTDTTTGFSYEWDGTVWKSYSASSSNQIKVLDDISGSFNGIGKTFALTSSSASLTPPNTASLIINLGGVIQDPSDDYSVSGSNIIFSDAPTSDLTFSGISLGGAIPVNTIGIQSGSTLISNSTGTLNFIGAGNTFAVRGSTIDISISGSGGNTYWDSTAAGISTLSNVGIGTTNPTSALTVKGNTSLDTLNVSGVATAASFVGDLTGTASYAASAGIATYSSISGIATYANTAGIATYATSSGIATYSETAGIATYASTSGIATYATSSGIATYTSTAGVSTSLLGGNAGINTTSTPTNLYVSGSSANNIVALGNTDAATTLDFSTGNDFSLTLTGSIVLSNPTGVTTGQSGVIYIQQDGSGSHTVGFGSHWDFPSATAPTLSTGANALDVLTYSVRTSTSIVAAALIGIGTI